MTKPDVLNRLIHPGIFAIIRAAALVEAARKARG